MVTSRALEAANSNGLYRHIHGIVINGATPVHDFLAALGDPDLSDFLSRFDKLDESGELRAKPWRQRGQWFKPLHHVSNVWQVSATTSAAGLPLRRHPHPDQRVLQDRRRDPDQADQGVRVDSKAVRARALGETS